MGAGSWPHDGWQASKEHGGGDERGREPVGQKREDPRGMRVGKREVLRTSWGKETEATGP